MKIVIAPNALKGSLSATEAAEAIKAGVRQAVPDVEIVALPVADGGDGFIAVLGEALGAVPQRQPVSGPVGQTVDADWLYSEGQCTAVIEIATASGLALIDPTQRAPMTANTRGVGELILTALEQGAQRILLGIGGSATNDGGMGMAQALGAVFVDSRGRSLEPGGGSLIEIAAIDITGLDPRLKEVNIQVICDVDNPLLGEQGAARVFGPQKGATPQQVAALEAGLAQFADVLDAQLGIDVRDVPGAGAGGGLGAGAIVFLGSELQPGAEVVLDLLGFNDVLKGADLVITAEGQLDGQTAFGKAPAAVAQRARAAGIPCIAIAGSLGEGVEGLAAIGIDAAYSLCGGSVSRAEAMLNAANLIKMTATQAVRAFRAGYRA